MSCRLNKRDGRQEFKWTDGGCVVSGRPAAWLARALTKCLPTPSLDHPAIAYKKKKPRAVGAARG
jgi:hypothetical protein